MRWLLLLWSTGALGERASVVVARGLSCSAACGIFSGIRDRTCVPCIDRRILNHCATREVLKLFFDINEDFSLMVLDEKDLLCVSWSIINIF